MSWEIIHSDCIDALKAMPDASVDSVVCDPPYGLGTREPSAEDLIAYLQGAAIDHGGDFMGKDWQIPPVAVWRECLRVLRPGGFLLAFAGTRTIELIAIGIRAAGFERRDTLAWVHAQGFPKSLSIDKAIDDAAGAERKVVGVNPNTVGRGTRVGKSPRGSGQDATFKGDAPVTMPSTDDARRWAGFGTALKPAFEPVIMARKPLGSTVAECVLKHGTGAINVDACRVAGIVSKPGGKIRASRSSAPNVDGRELSGVGLVDAPEPHAAGRWPANLVLSHFSPSSCPCAELTPDREPIPGCRACGGSGTLPGCVRKGTKRVRAGPAEYERSVEVESRIAGVAQPKGAKPVTHSPDGTEEVEAWECEENCPVRLLDEQSGSAGMHTAGGACDPKFGYGGRDSVNYQHGGAGFRVGDVGDGANASRFFQTFSHDPLDDVTPFFYCAKPSRAETEAGCDDLPERTAKDAVERDPDSAGAHNPRAGSGRGAGATRYRCAACGKGLSGGGDDHGETSPCDATEDRQHVKVASGKGKAIRNTHPTKKSVSLMRWLVRLVTPPGGTVLDCFAGSGSTGVACVIEGFRFIGIEREAEYVTIARARCERAVDVKTSAAVIEVRDEATGRRVEVKARQAELFVDPPIEIPSAVLSPPVPARVCVECGATVEAGLKYRCSECVRKR